jgi:hypothetical protein
MSEIDYRALRLCTERAEVGPLAKRRALAKLEKAWKAGGMGYPANEPEEWKWRMCEARMMLGYFEDWEGWQYRNRWARSLWFNYKKGAWQGQEGDIWVFGEQGLGDEILFSQAIPDAQRLCKGLVTVECEPRLVSVFERSFGVRAVPVSIEALDSGKDGRIMSLATPCPWIPMGDLLRNFRRFPQQFKRAPWLIPDPLEVKKYEKYKGRTAIVWRGAQGEWPWQKIARLFKDPISLQYDQRPDELVEKPELDVRNDVEGILGLLASVDQLVGPSNTAIHMAGAIGTKVEVVLAPLNGRRKNQLPFRYFGIPGSQKSMWYGDHLTRWDSLEKYENSLRMAARDKPAVSKVQDSLSGAGAREARA